MTDFNDRIGVLGSRSAHGLAIAADRLAFETRENLARLFNVADEERMVFCKNATEALNLAIFGLLQPQDHVITSSMEHNAVIRPLRSLEREGTIKLTLVPCSQTGELDLDALQQAINSRTKAIFLTHGSNVTGTIMPIAAVAQIAKKHNLIFCVDAAQTAGCYEIDIDQTGIDLVAFTGHKALFGPGGTGGLYIGKGLEKRIKPLIYGGTGSRSEQEDQPEFLPDKYEAGTPNTFGLAALNAGIKYLLEARVATIRKKELQLISYIHEGLSTIKGVTLYGPKDPNRKMAVISFNIADLDPGAVALALEEDYKILSRPGLHCAPLAHKTIGTFPQGTNRFSLSCFNTKDEIDIALKAIEKLVYTCR